jgi:hypothetical protein
MNYQNTPNATSSPGSVDGPSLSLSQDGPHLDLFGLDLAPASRSVSQAKEKEEAMIATSGPSFVGLSPSSVLSESLGSRLRKRLASTGSMEYRQTWKRMATRSGRLYWAHTASGLRTSDNAFTGWPTVSTEDHKTDGPKAMAKIYHAIETGTPMPTTCQRLRNIAALAGWRSPATTEPGVTLERLVDAEGNPWMPGQRAYDKHTGRLAQVGLTHEAQAALRGWATPRAEDAESCGMRHSRGVADTLSAQVGQDLMSSTAGTAKPAALNPEHSRWLMGFPVAWGCCGATAMQSFRKRLPSS